MLYHVWTTRRIHVKGRPYVLRWRDPPGSSRIRQETIGPMSAKRAELYRQKLEADLNGCLQDGEAPVTWAEFRDGYLAAIRPELARLSVTSARTTLAAFERIARPSRLLDVDGALVERFKEGRLAEVGVETVRRDLRTLRAALAWAVRRKDLKENPAAGVTVGRHGRPQAEGYTLQETDRLLAEAARGEPWLNAAVRLAVGGGLRIGELAALDRTDLDLARGLLTIRRKAGWTPKSGKARVVPLDDEAVRVLKELDASRLAIGPAAAGMMPILWGPVDAPFPGAEAFKAAMRRGVAALAAAAGLRVLAKPVHGLRVTAADNMDRAGVPEGIKVMILGHCEPGVTRAHYQGVAAEDAAEIAKRALATRETRGDA